MGRRVATGVRVTDENGVMVVLPAGSEVPAWALPQITNEAAFLPEDASDVSAVVTVEAESEVEGGAGEPFTPDTPQEASVDYASMKVAELRALAEQRGLPTDGTKAELVALLEEAAQS